MLTRLPLSLLAVCVFLSLPAYPRTITLEVDATHAPQKIVHVKLRIPTPPGPLSRLYPKWLPGTHGPMGDVVDIAGLTITAAGKKLVWLRDPVDMHTFSCQVPPGADGVEVAFDYLINSHGTAFFGGNSTEKVYVLNWEQVVFYPRGEKPEQLTYTASLHLPSGWLFATALPVEKQGNDTVQFKPVSLYKLIDSPLNAGIYFRRFPLAPSIRPLHELDVVADSEDALDIPQDFITKYSKMVEEASALFGNHPYTQYRFLITLSDQLGHWGLEHHESSDIKMQEDMFTGDELDRLASMTVIPHEFTHTWNGKYRRPAGMITTDYQDPEHTDLVWMYEGLTEYVAYVLAGRSGLMSPQEEHESLAWLAAALGQPRPGRTWRTLLDTATASQLGFYPAYFEWVGWRRKNDFYWEGPLIWLDADIRIRQLTQGRKSLDDFLRDFFGKAQAPVVEPYEMQDVIASLNRIAPSDWADFFKTRVNEIAPEPPLGGITEGGWKLVYDDKANQWDRSLGQVNGRIISLFTLGFSTTFDGTVTDTVPGMPGVKAGIGPGMKLLAVNGRLWSSAIFRSAVKHSASTNEPIDLLLQNGDYVGNYHVDYHGGERQPHLARNESKADLLDAIFTPLTAAK